MREGGFPTRADLIRLQGDAICAAYEESGSMAEVARRFALSEQAVSNTLHARTLFGPLDVGDKPRNATQEESLPRNRQNHPRKLEAAMCDFARAPEASDRSLGLARPRKRLRRTR